MMRLFRFLLIINVFVLPALGFCQEDANAEQLTGYIKYHKKVQPQPFSDELTDINAFLDFNANESFYITNRIGMDSLADLGGMKYDAQKAVLTTATHDNTGTITYRNFKTKELSFNYPKVGPLPAYKVIDNWLAMDWKLTDETKIISGYTAQKAYTTFRGTDFTVWFTKDIPLPYGPMKLFGLPGIILEVWYDGVKRLSAYEICYPCQNIDTIAPPPETITKTIKEHVHIQDNFDYYLFTEMNKNSNGGFVTMNKMPTERDVWEKRQQGIEKIYEWENKKTKRLVKASELRKIVTPKKETNKSLMPINTFPDRPEPIQRPNL